MSNLALRRTQIIVCIILLCLISAGLALTSVRVRAQAEDPVTAAWQRARAAGMYTFTSDVVQQTIPNTSVANVGRASRSDQFRMEGTTNLHANQLTLRLWSDSGSVLLPESGVAVRVEDGKTFTRRGFGEWQTGDSFTDGVAPAGDFMAWLAAVEDVTAHAPEERAGIVFTRYSFQINGAAYAAFVRDNMEEAMRQKGELPPGVHLDLPTYYRDMQGDGELWIGNDGLPLRQILNLRFPEQNAERVATQIKVDFSDFGGEGAVLSPEAKVQSLGAWLADFGPWTLDFGLLLTLLPMLAAVALIIRYQRVGLLYNAVTIAVIFSMVLGPVLSNIKIVAFLDTQTAQAATQDENRRAAEQQREWQAINAASDFNPHESPVAAGEREAEIALASANLAAPASVAAADALFLTDTGLDRDSDGLSDFIEERIGTAMTYQDSDEDLLFDNLEVAGFTMGGQQWYTDPNAEDSNNDGLSDFMEWDANGNGQIDDTDGDGIPDLFENDNDNDGVPDRKDLAPLISGNGARFGENAPLNLTLRNLEAGIPTLVNFQLRPQDPQHLGFAFNVLDWPQDSAGQVRDIDGQSYADAAVAQGRTTLANEAYGDMKLVPMLELRVPVDNAQLPPQSDLTPYNITNNNVSADGTQRILYVPLTVTSDEQTGAHVAFSGQMRYLPSGTWTTPHQARLVWVVQVLADIPCDPNATAAQPGCLADGYIHNQAQVVQSYYDAWQLTGLTVREDHGTDVAIVYEDPALDTNQKDEAALWALASGLTESFIGGRDQNNDTQRDVNLSEIARRFDRTGNGGVSETERWAIPNILRVERADYTVFEHALASTTMTETRRILDSQFAPAWHSDKTIKPLLLYTQEATFRSVGLDAQVLGGGYATLSGNALTLDMQPAGQPRQIRQVQASMQWTAFCAPDAGSPLWAACDPEAYWHELEARHFSPTGLAGDNANDPDIIYGRMGMVQLFHLAISQGINRVVEIDNVVFSSRYSQDDDTTIERIVRALLAVTNLAIMETANYVILARYYFKEPVLKFVGNEIREIGGLIPIGGNKAATSIKGDIVNFGKGIGIAIAVVTLLAVLISLTAAEAPGAEIALRVTIIGFILVLSVLGPAMAAAELIKTGTLRFGPQTTNVTTRQILNAQAENIKFARAASAIGAALTIAVAWGFFIYSMVDNKASAFSPQFNSALAEVIATTIYAILIAILFATVVGVIIAGVIALIDAILTSICELGVDDLRKVPGLGGACFTLSTSAIKLIAKLLYSFDIMIDTDRKDLTVTGEPSLVLANPDKGFTVGNALTLTLPVTTTIVHKDPAVENLHHIGPYLWFFTASNLRSTTFQYSLSSGKPVTLSVDLNNMRNAWQGVRVDHSSTGGLIPFLGSMYRGQAVSPHGPVSTTVTIPGINRPVQTYLNMGYALPSYECWSIPNPFPVPYPRFFPVCYPRSLEGNTSTALDTLKFDYFPATLADFIELVDKGNGGLGLKWDAAFGALADADGDGLIAATYNGLDPNDNAWDADGDGLADSYELERRQAGVAYSPIQRDTDNDGLTDLQEAQLGTNPALADTDNDGLRDGEEVWHRRYDPSTGAATNTWEGGWNVTVVGLVRTVTVRVSANPLDPDADGDGVSDQAERQLALDAIPARRLDNQNRPYHPNVFNTPPLVIYTAVDDDDRYVTPGQSLRYTSTVVANAAMAPGVLEVTRPAALGTAALLYGLPFNPLTFSQSQTVTQPTALTVAANAASGTANVVSTARVRLPDQTGPTWVFDPIATGTLGGFTNPARWPDVAFARNDRQDAFRVAALVSDSAAQRGLGDIWSYQLPAGAGVAIEDDASNTTFLRGATPPGVACNNAGVCMVVWDQYDNCNNLVINSLKVVTAASDPLGGIEPFINLGPAGTNTRLWDWTRGGGTSDMQAGEQRGPNAFGFPVTMPFCGGVNLYAWESDGNAPDGSPVNQTVGSHAFTQGDFISNQVFTFSGSGHTYEINITIPAKDTYVLGGALIQANGTRQALGFPNTSGGLRLYDFRPTVTSDGTNFLVVAEQARDNASGGEDTLLVLRRLDANGNPLGIQRKQVTLADRSAALTSPSLMYDPVWRGDSYRIAWRFNHLGAINFQNYAPDLTPIGDTTTVATDVLISPELPEISLAYNPLTNQDLLLYKQTGGGLAGRLFADNGGQVGSQLNLSAAAPAYRPSAVWNPITQGWLASWTNNAGAITVAPLNADGSALVAPGSITGGANQTNALACPAPNSSPLVDLRFEELPGATLFTDSSGYGNAAICNGTTCPGTGTAGAPNAPLSDYALQFDGVDDFISQPREVQADFSIALWIKTTQLNGRLVDAGRTNALGFALTLFDGRVFLERPGRTFGSGTAVRYNDNQWHFVVATRSGTNNSAALYVDGVQVATGSLGTEALTGQARLYIGLEENNTSPFAGAIDQFQLFPVSLAVDSVAALYNRTLQAYCVVAGTRLQNNVEWSKITLRQPDYRGGRISASSTLNLTVDADAPLATVTSVQNNQYIQGATGAPLTFIIGGTASDATSGVSKVEVRANGGAFSLADGAETWTYPLQVTEGSYTLEARATDAVNRTGALSPAITLIADGQPPQISYAAPATVVRPTQVVAGQWIVNLTGTVVDPNAGAQPGSGVKQVAVLLQAQHNTGLPNTWQVASLNGGNWSLNYLFANDKVDPTGSYTVTLRAVDNVGNQTAEIVAGSLHIDSAAPSAALGEIDANRGVISQTLTLSGVISDSAPTAQAMAGVDQLEVDFAPIDEVSPFVDAELYLPFDERNGALYFNDRSGQGNGGGCGGCPVDETGGRGDGALQLSGSSGIRVPAVSSLNFGQTGSFSIHVWVKPTGFGNIVQTGSSADIGSYAFGINGQGGPRLAWTLQPNQASLFDSQPNLIDNQWHQMVVTIDRTSQRVTMYVDGIGRASAALGNASFGNFGFLEIGRFPGLLDEIAIFKRALSAEEVATLYRIPARQWRPATLAQRGAGIHTSTWTLPAPSGLEGLYQIDLRGTDVLGNRQMTANAWRGIVDTNAPRVTLSGQATGQSYLDTATGTPRYEITYTCRAEDFQLNEASFNCAGNAVRPPTHTFNTNATFKQLFPDLSLLTTLVNTYTVWAESSTPVGELTTCDILNQCTTAGVPATGAPAAATADTVTAAAVGEPKAVIVAPTQGSAITAQGEARVTIAAEAAQGLKAVVFLLDDRQVAQIDFAQADNVIHVLRTVTVLLPDQGQHKLEVYATDWAGAQQQTLVPVFFTIYTGAPTVTIDNPNLTVSDSYGPGSYIYRLHGTVSDASIDAVQIKIGDQPAVSAPVINGSWRFAAPLLDPDNALSITVRVLNPAGQSNKVEQILTVDPSGGQTIETSLVETPANPSSDPARFQFQGLTADNQTLVYFECAVDGQAFTPCTSPHTYTGLSQGEHVFQVRAFNDQGLVDPTPAVFTWQVQGNEPLVVLEESPTMPTTSRAANFRFRAPSLSDASARYDCQLDGGSFAPCTSPQPYANLADGTHTFQVRAKAQDGAVPGTPTRFVWTVNNATPLVTDQTIATNQDTAVAITLVAGDEDALTYKVGTPAHGVLVGIPPALTYSPNTGYTGPDSFTFTASDGLVESNLGTITLDVQGSTTGNQAPVAVDDGLPTTSEIVAQGRITLTTLLDNDSDPDDTTPADGNCTDCSIVAVGQASQGTVTLSGLGVTYVATNRTFLGTDTFTYTVADNDPRRALTDSAQVAVTVQADAVAGDCNANGTVDAGDLTALGLEIFDGDGNRWYDAAGGSVAFSPYGCDANADAVIDAGDLTCTARRIFATAFVCGSVVAAQASPATLAIGSDLFATLGTTVDVPLVLDTGGQAVAATAFSLHWEAAHLGFDPTDANADGIPDAVTFHLPSGLLATATYHAAASRLDIIVLGIGQPFAQLGDGPLATVRLTVPADSTQASTALTLSTASLGGVEGQSLPLTVRDGAVQLSTQTFRLLLPLVSR